ncbi:hypothetical protein LR48_Vigan04g174300 [Vigna angularis]|uniref:L-ascorbate oxidase-like protein n=1 Tax=Phaseolus angularis TaxID=3914 RepID=A0A0L9UF82_PHAAN|nr:L-ascorbate oxidase-like protein [Vigna angularis]KOM41545.1 hypothetical protein LR48_Vigan04g174300 [Vigna angularis]
MKQVRRITFTLQAAKSQNHLPLPPQSKWPKRKAPLPYRRRDPSRQHPWRCYIVDSSLFIKTILPGKEIIRYVNGNGPAAPEIPEAPIGRAWSLNQCRSFRWNLTTKRHNQYSRAVHHRRRGFPSATSTQTKPWPPCRPPRLKQESLPFLIDHN